MAGHALFFTDLVDSTAAVERLGDARAADVLAEHDRRARALLARHGGREIDHSDGFFLLFESTHRAAAFTLAYHAAPEGFVLGYLGAFEHKQGRIEETHAHDDEALALHRPV
ncbi:MAG TPA: hypothetical protein VH041_08265, partial [Caldimonas sp.]